MLTQQELQELQRLVSGARLSSYSRFLGTRTAAQAYGAYMWSTAVSAAFSPLVQAVEIGLRNTLNDGLAPIFGSNWFEYWVNQEALHMRARGGLAPNQQSEGQRLIQKAKAKVRQRDTADYRRKGLGNTLPATYVPNWQSVLAELTFGFWVRFLSRWYWDVNNKTKLWPNHISTAFPGSPSNMHSVGALHNAYEKAVDMRNRIHHQEPLWKHWTVNTAPDALQYLTTQLQETLTLLDYLGASKRASLEKYGVVASVQELCTKEAFERFTGQGQQKAMPLCRAKRDLRGMAKKTQDHQSVWVESGKSLHLVIRNANRRFF